MVVYEEPVRIQLPEYLLTLLLGVLLNKKHHGFIFLGRTLAFTKHISPKTRSLNQIMQPCVVWVRRWHPIPPKASAIWTTTLSATELTRVRPPSAWRTKHPMLHRQAYRPTDGVLLGR